MASSNLQIEEKEGEEEEQPFTSLQPAQIILIGDRRP